MKIRCLFDEMVSVKKLKPHPQNRNKHPAEQITRLADILEYQGWRYPIKVSKLSGFITSGHGRLEAAKKAGLKEVPVNYQEYESVDQEYADLTADNAIALWAEIDFAAINADLPDLGPDFNIDMLGLKDFILEPADKLEPGCDEDEVPEKVEPKTKLGDLYELGSHRLLCGDATNIQHVERLMNGQKADITFTSPPYNAERQPTQSERNRPNHQYKKYENHDDGMSQEDYRELISAFLAIARGISKYQLINIQHLAGNKTSLIEWLYNFREAFVDTLIWFKEYGMPQMAEKVLNSAFEYIYIFSSEELPSKAVKTATFRNIDNVYIGKKQTSNEFSGIHAATFPVHLPEFISNNFCPTSGSIYDCFGGTGTTMIACEKTNRKCFMMELDPHYCDVIVARWEKFTGKKAVLLTENNAPL